MNTCLKRLEYFTRRKEACQELSPYFLHKIRKYAQTDGKGAREMECFQVLEAEEGIQQAILRRLAARGGLGGRCARGNHPTLVVVSPRAAAAKVPLPRQCRTVLLPGGTSGLPLRAASAVSYGASPRDSLTLSSREGDTLWAALQRELVTVDGQVVERQEFPLRLEPGAGELPSLAAAGALLLLGVPPEELGRPGG